MSESEAKRLREIVRDYAAICQASSQEIKMLRDRIAELEEQLAGGEGGPLPEGD